MMAARRNRFDGHPPRIAARPRWVDSDDEWKPRIDELADGFGWTRKSVWFWFHQIRLAIFLEASWPQPVAEAWAFECITRAIDKRGSVAS